MTVANQPIAVAGEALVDLVLEADGATTPHLGGGSYNTARTIGRLGLGPVFVGRISRDEHGRALRAGLAESGVRLDGIVDTDDPTTFALVELDRTGTASYRFYADGTSISGLMPEEARAAMPPSPAGLHVGGLGLVFEPQARAIAGLVQDASSQTLILLDPNCRPDAAANPLLHRELLREVLQRVDVVKTSEEDLAYIEPDRAPLQAARELLKRGPRVVLVTHGSRGVTVLASARETAIPTPRVHVVDTIGAGDAFGGGWLGAWVADGLGRADLDDFDAVVKAARFAARVAARTCERAGAEPPYAARLDADWCFAAAVHRSNHAARAD
jgi:fructokinase